MDRDWKEGVPGLPLKRALLQHLVFDDVVSGDDDVRHFFNPIRVQIGRSEVVPE